MLRSIVEDEGTRHFVRCHHFERIAAPRGAQNANAPAMEAG
jgi:peptide/nickel transport system ATP-binding protein